MILQNFQIRLFRSIVATDTIEVSQVTPLVGINESGKTNILLALEAVRPDDDGIIYPSHEDLTIGHSVSDLSSEKHFGQWFIKTKWTFTAEEAAELKRRWSRFRDGVYVIAGRAYDSTQRIEIIYNAKVLEVNLKTLKPLLRRAQLSDIESGETAAAKIKIKSAWTALMKAVNSGQADVPTWAKKIGQAVATYKGNDLQSTTLSNSAISKLELYANKLREDPKQVTAAFEYIREHFPRFIYVSDYPDLAGRQDLDEYFSRKASDALDDADVNFEALMQLAGLDQVTLSELRTYDSKRQSRILNEAGMRVTKLLRKTWKSRDVNVRFAINGKDLCTMVADSTTAEQKEVNLEDRSKGFQWFFSFYVLYANRLRSAVPNILLLDEPGLHLHPKAQADLIRVLEEQSSQVLYTTHSPFMLSPEDLGAVRTVEYTTENGTHIANSISGDESTLFPLQAALGYSLTQTLFVGPYSLIVEGVTDFWYLTAVSEYLSEFSNDGLNGEIVITPAGGAPKVAYMAALLSAQKVKVVALLDSEPSAQQIAKSDIIRQKILYSKQVVFINDVFEGEVEIERDIEDMLDEATFAKLVEQSYAKELATTTLNLNPFIPRICRRYETAFEAVAIPFNKSRPAKQFLRNMAGGDLILSNDETQRFKRLFEIINVAMDAIKDKSPFEK